MTLVWSLLYLINIRIGEQHNVYLFITGKEIEIRGYVPIWCNDDNKYCAHIDYKFVYIASRAESWW